MKNKLTRKGFTIVELVIVIAVIAILAAVLIPTFSNLIQKSKVSADQQLIRNLNSALTTDSAVNGKHTTMQSALDAAFECGYDVTKIVASADSNKILWDQVNDVFCYLDGDEIKYIPDSVETGLAKNDYRLWVISNTVDLVYSTYYTGNDATIETSKGFDSGKSTTVTTINYSSTGTQKDVIICTNSALTTLNVNAPGDTINHYGLTGKVTISAIDFNCYKEYGESLFLSLFEGKVLAKAGGKIGVVYATNSDPTKVSVVEDGGTIVEGYTTAAEIDTTNQANGGIALAYDKTVAQIEEIGSLSVASETGVLPDGMNYAAVVNNVGFDSLKEAIESAKEGDTVSILKDITIAVSDAMGEISYYWKNQGASKSRPAGVRYASVGIVIDKSLTINGNGHSITTTTKNTQLGDYAGASLAITANNAKVVLKNLTMTTSEMSAVVVGENVTGITLDIISTNLRAATYAIKLCNGSDNANVTIEESSIYGWAAVNTRGNNCNFIVDGSDLSGENTASESSSNNYASFVIDGDTCNDNATVVGTYGSNNKVTITSSKISATSASANEQTWLSIQYGAVNNTVIADSTCVLTRPSEWTFTDETEGLTNSVKVSGIVYEGKLEETN